MVTKNLYAQLAELPIPVAAEFIGNNVIQLKSTIKNHNQNVKRTFSKYIHLPPSGSDPTSTVLPFSTPYEEVSSRIVAGSWSPSKNFRISLVNDTSGTTPKRRIEFWAYSKEERGIGAGKIEVEMDVTERHGAFYADEFLGSLTWSSDEKSFVYTAEANAPTASDGDPYAKFRFKPDCGEGLVGKRRPTLFMFHLDHRATEGQTSKTGEKKPSLYQLTIPAHPDVLYGQAVFAPSFTAIPGRESETREETIYVTGYEYLQDGRLLGIKGCTNRPTGIWEITIPLSNPTSSDGSADNGDAGKKEMFRCTANKITQPYQSCRSPKVYHSGMGSNLYTVVWLVSATGGAHMATSSIFKFQRFVRGRIAGDNGEQKAVPEKDESKEYSEPVQVVDYGPVAASNESPSDLNTLPGFYPLGTKLPPNAFIHTGALQSTPGPWVISDSIHGSRSTIVLVDTTQRFASLKDLTPNDGNTLWSWNVLGTDLHRRVICTRSTINKVCEVLLGTFDDGGNVGWTVIDNVGVPENLKDQLSKLEVSIHPIPGRYPAETMLIRSVDANKDTPCVTNPHGGPHATTTTAFNPSATALALEGYTVSLPNYTGSLGYGENAVRALIGHCGTLDVEDCISSVRYLIEKGFASEGPGKLFISGGSHGGFLAAHLIGQYPDMFTAAVMRNPVITADPSSTDIPDWYFAEFGLPFPMASSPATLALASSKSDSQSSQTSTLASSQTPLLSPTIYTKLHSAAPIAYVDHVKTPVLLMIGAEDRRVTPVHGIGYYHALKQRGVEVDMLVFEGESHPLDGVETSKAQHEAGVDWFEKFREGAKN